MPITPPSGPSLPLPASDAGAASHAVAKPAAAVTAAAAKTEDGRAAPAAAGKTPATVAPATTTRIATVPASTPVIAAGSISIAPASPMPQWSAAAVQGVRMQVLENIVAEAVQQIPASVLQASWPAQGVAPQWASLIDALVSQSTASVGVPQQVIAVQLVPQTLVQALLQAVQTDTATDLLPPKAAAGAVINTLLDQPATEGKPPTASKAGVATPAAVTTLQNWLVRQGTVLVGGSERSFSMALQMPTAWLNAVAALAVQESAVPAATAAAHAPNTEGPARTRSDVATPGLPGVVAATLPPVGAANLSTPGVWRLPFAVPMQQLQNTSIALVLQGRDAVRSSALLVLEFQPLPPTALAQQQAAQQASGAWFAASGVAQAVEHAAQARQDPWVQMAVAQASGQLPRERLPTPTSEQCNQAGCQYEGRAACPQPFCPDMNRLWALDRQTRR